MSNMSYCRFQNTLSDLKDCYYSMEDLDFNATDQDKEQADGDNVRVLSKEETMARRELIKLCS